MLRDRCYTKLLYPGAHGTYGRCAAVWLRVGRAFCTGFTSTAVSIAEMGCTGISALTLLTQVMMDVMHAFFLPLRRIRLTKAHKQPKKNPNPKSCIHHRAAWL